MTHRVDFALRAQKKVVGMAAIFREVAPYSGVDKRPEQIAQDDCQ
jgi:hypothetical protein